MAPRRSRLGLCIGVAGVLLVLSAVAVAYHGIRAIHAGTQAKVALLQAETSLGSSRLEETTAELQRAQSGFTRMKHEIHALGPLLAVARITPFIRIQVKGAEAFADAGRLLADSGLRLTDTAQTLVHPADGNVSASDALDSLRALQTSLRSGVTFLDAAVAKVASLNGYRLVGPIGKARADMAARLPRIQSRASSAQSGMDALVAFTGGSGPRRYLFLSQNPAEQRPTGGFIGTYGVVSATDGKLALDRYSAIESWTSTHPQAAIPPGQAGSPFPFIPTPFPQTLANVNSVPDWPRVARLAMDMWQRGGEQPVDGVLSVSTGFLARILAVIGPTTIESYGEVVSDRNVVDRIDFYARQPVPNRKDFVAAVAEAVLGRVLQAPSSQWQQLGTTLGQAFDAREAMAWTTDPTISATLAARRWDGSFPVASGDFFYDSHFAFATKNGLGVKRTYDHDVVLRADGSGLVTTTMTINNTQPASQFNTDTLAYITTYGPRGGSIDPTSEVPAVIEPTMADHPAAGFFRSAPPLGKTTLRVAWNVPGLLARSAGGTWIYSLDWRRIPDHSGDVLHLKIQLPPGWTWRDAKPPETVDLGHDVHGTWTMQYQGFSS